MGIQDKNMLRKKLWERMCYWWFSFLFHTLLATSYKVWKDKNLSYHKTTQLKPLLLSEAQARASCSGCKELMLNQSNVLLSNNWKTSCKLKWKLVWVFFLIRVGPSAVHKHCHMTTGGEGDMRWRGRFNTEVFDADPWKLFPWESLLGTPVLVYVVMVKV